MQVEHLIFVSLLFLDSDAPLSSDSLALAISSTPVYGWRGVGDDARDPLVDDACEPLIDDACEPEDRASASRAKWSSSTSSPQRPLCSFGFASASSNRRFAGRVFGESIG